MKYKVLVVLAAVSLIAASCNKATTAPGNQNDQSQQSQQSMDNSGATAPNTQTQTKDNANGPDFTPGQSGASAEAGLNADMAAQPEVVEVDMTANGFSPANITINKGDYVQFVNKDTAPHWPASNPHPVHTDLPGFDAKQGVAPGAYYRYQFEKTGTWGYHDHLHPSTMGTVTVK